MSLINISLPDKFNDPNYRYKREKAIVSYSAKNGSVTNLSNFSVITSNLSRCLGSVKYNNKVSEKILKIMKKTLGVNIDVKIDRGEYEVSIRGKIGDGKIEEIVQSFIAKYILCSNCHLPEINGLTKTCRACGYSKEEDKKEEAYALTPRKQELIDNTKIKIEKETETNNKLDIEISEVLKKLYNLRHYLISTRDKKRLAVYNNKDLEQKKEELIAKINKYIDECWVVNNEKWTKLSDKITNLLKGYDYLDLTEAREEEEDNDNTRHYSQYLRY